MSNEFQIGDCAVLISGGPKMVITEIDKKGICTCEWFVEDQLAAVNVFPTLCLKKVNPQYDREK